MRQFIKKSPKVLEREAIAKADPITRTNMKLGTIIEEYAKWISKLKAANKAPNLLPLEVVSFMDTIPANAWRLRGSGRFGWNKHLLPKSQIIQLHENYTIGNWLSRDESYHDYRIFYNGILSEFCRPSGNVPGLVKIHELLALPRCLGIIWMDPVTRKLSNPLSRLHVNVVTQPNRAISFSGSQYSKLDDNVRRAIPYAARMLVFKKGYTY